MSQYVAVDHPRFRRASTPIFTNRIVADCMTHRCTLVVPGREQLDACCQYGVDVDLGERDAIVARKDELRALLRADVADTPWFHDAEELDPDVPSGRLVRTRTVDNGCVFLAHDRRGCAIHRAALEHGWDYRSAKPHVCRLFPLTYTHDAIVVSNDYPDYSCAHAADAPTLYRVTRDALGDVFGVALVAALDVAEAHALARRLVVS